MSGRSSNRRTVAAYERYAASYARHAAGPWQWLLARRLSAT